jgi:iron complex transport system substrate-binding protein
LPAVASRRRARRFGWQAGASLAPQALNPRGALHRSGPIRLAALIFCLFYIPAVAGQTASPNRIVSIIPAVTEMLFAIGAGDRVVGVGSFDHYPAAVEKLPRVGALLDPDLERILALRPDLVVVYRSQTDLKQQLARSKIPIFEYSHAGLPDVMRTIRSLGEAAGRSQDAERVATGIERSLAELRKRVAGRERPRVLVVFGRESGALRGIYASGGVGFLHDMLTVAGGTNVLEDIKRESTQATTELILSRRPDVILELRGTPAGDQELEAMRSDWNALRSVPAVANDRVHIIADERVVVPGPRVAEGTELLARAIHPQAFQ